MNFILDKETTVGFPMAEILIVEPFYGGSHKQMVDLLLSKIIRCDVVKMPAKKWHWRARTGALYLSQQIEHAHIYRTLFTTSVLNLAELLSLRPDLHRLRKIVYFHENQLVYPVKKHQDRDFQYGYNQILSCIVADVVVFNSKYNMDSFLSSIKTFLKLIPDHRPTGIADIVRPKCRVIYFPLDLPDKGMDQSSLSGADGPNIGQGETLEQMKSKDMNETLIQTFDDKKTQTPIIVHCSETRRKPLHIVWAHRWEHDKDPDSFFSAIFELSEAGCDFNLSVLGEQFTDVPDIFIKAKDKLAKHIVNWGYQDTKEDYVEILKSADVSVSTALHEFFGVSMLESVYYGCYPLCPNRLVYPEIYPAVYLYNTPRQLVKTLKRYCKFPAMVREHRCQVPIEKYLWCNLGEDYIELFNEATISVGQQTEEDCVT